MSTGQRIDVPTACRWVCDLLYADPAAADLDAWDGLSVADWLAICPERPAIEVHWDLPHPSNAVWVDVPGLKWLLDG